MMRRFLFLFGFILLVINAMATHNRAGEITFTHISGYTYEFKIVTYTYSLSPADRPQLPVNWGDGTNANLQRYSKVSLPNQTNMNLYSGYHTFAGPGTYVVSVEDPNRNGGVINIPNSINTPFYIETVLTINPFLGINNSVQLLNPPIDNGCVAYPFIHNPGAYDPDGDSLSYELVVCKGAGGNPIPGYSYPQASHAITIDPVTGTLTWDSPVLQGEYNVAIIIYEWRNGIQLGSVRRDMQILIASCSNNPPRITVSSDTCVLVGQSLSVPVTAVDVDNDLVTLTATGGPLLVSGNHATFNQPVYAYGSVSSTFQWTPECSHVRKYPYQMTFKAKDNGSPVNLVDIKTMRVKVIAPAVQNLVAVPQGNSIRLNWSKHSCANAVRYDIYRNNSYIGYLPNTCVTGVPSWTGYVRVGGTPTATDTVYVDNNAGYGLIPGYDYCYMVVAIFPDSAESYPSLEACAQLSRDVPVITHVTVDSTDQSHGVISLKWSKPVDLDTTLVPGPYKYLISHSTGAGNTNMSLIDSLSDWNDTVYVVKGLNTKDVEHNFKVDFINNQAGNRFVIGSTQIASSVFIKAEPGDEKVKLSWAESVPWFNDQYVIYRRNATLGYDSIGYSTTRHFVDSNLTNGQEYCYKIKALGHYSAQGFTDPLINFSQELCNIPEDSEAPCPPELSLSGDCQKVENYIVWTKPPVSCGGDVKEYTLYYKPDLNSDFTVIYQTGNINDTSFIHSGINSISGCYVVTATDSNGNVSPYSNQACMDIDSCRLYRLPNVFTPNGDGFNDEYGPFPYDFVDKIELTIFNRWGVPVFKTEDPDIHWDGKDMNTNNKCSDGIYFYVCYVYELRLEGLTRRELTGTITLYR